MKVILNKNFNFFDRNIKVYSFNFLSSPLFSLSSRMNFSTSIVVNNDNNNNNNNNRGYSTLFDHVIFIDKGIWKILVFPANKLDDGINELFSKFKEGKNYVLFIQGKYAVQHISIGPKVLVNNKTTKEFIKMYFDYYLGLLSENYDIDSISDLIFKFKDTEILKIEQPVLPKETGFVPIIPKSYMHEKLFPASASNDNFGELVSSSINNLGQEVFEFEYNKFNIHRTQLNKNKYFNEVYLNGTKFTSFTDEIFKNGTESDKPYFIRTINEKYKLYYRLDTKTIFKQEVYLKPGFMKNVKLNFNESKNIITFDIEAYLEKQTGTQKIKEFLPYACGWYNGSNAKTYYLTDFDSHVSMIAEALKDIFEFINSSKNHDKKFAVYAHNLGEYDGVYIIEALQTLGKVKPLIKDNKIIYIDAHKECEYLGKGNITKTRTIKIRLFDSYLLMPVNLRDLANEFNSETKKGVFPYNFVNKYNLDYVGNIPSFSYYDDLTDNEYMALAEKFKDKWSLRAETLAYLEKDVIALYEVLMAFSEEIFNEYNFNITNFPTISSLAMGIYRGHHLKDEFKIPLLTGQVHNFIRKSYFGGATEVYKPRLDSGYLYDVNSLYPAAMKNLMPVGSPKFSSETNLEKIFGFCLVKVKTPKNINIPILPFKDETGKTIFPVGEWIGLYFSEELKEAQKYGYKFTILQSLQFEKADIFSEFVDRLYEVKNTNEGAKKRIAKLLLNSAYGRFGLKDTLEETVLVKTEEADKIYSIYNVKEAISLNNGYELIRYNIKPDLNKIQVPSVLKEAAKISEKVDRSKIDSNSSIAIASAITAYARIHMNQYKFIPENPMYATDTDSGHFEHPLPDHMIGPELGKMKLEHKYTNAYFLAPKLYGFIKENGEPKVVAKGIGPKFNYSEIVALYETNNSIKVNKDVWVKDLSEYKIKVVTREIEIKGELTKREKVFNAQGQWIDTRPLIIKDGIVINKISQETISSKTSEIKLLSAPSYKLIEAPSYKLLPAPDYKLLPEPRISIEILLERYFNLARSINKLKVELESYNLEFTPYYKLSYLPYKASLPITKIAISLADCEKKLIEFLILLREINKKALYYKVAAKNFYDVKNTRKMAFFIKEISIYKHEVCQLLEKIRYLFREHVKFHSNSFFCPTVNKKSKPIVSKPKGLNSPKKREYSTKINNNINILKPIENSAGELLAPIILNDNVLIQMDEILFALSRVEDSNFVKIWLKKELEQDKIIIKATKNKDIELLNEIKKIKTFEIEEQEPNMFSDYLGPEYYFYDIKRNDLRCGNNKGIFTFKDSETVINEILKKRIKKKSSLNTCTYVVSFDNKYYYYIGSTFHIKNRLRTHSKNINNFLEDKNSNLNQMFKYFLDSETHHLTGDDKGEKSLDYRINTTHLCSDSLNELLGAPPDYELSKGEWISLYTVTDFIIKTLEQSLLIEYQPKLNMIDEVVFQNFEWEDKFLNIYPKNRKIREYFKFNKYNIFQRQEVEYEDYSTELDTKKFKDVLIETSTLYSLRKNYNLNKKEILNNLGSWHNYEGTYLVNPLKIVKIEEHPL